MTDITSVQDKVECAICYDTFKSSTISLICGHKFDENCIVSWFNKGNHTCPCCRAIIPQPIVINKTITTKCYNINTPRITINYKKRVDNFISGFIFTVILVLCFALYNNVIQYKIHYEYVNNNNDTLLTFLFLLDILLTFVNVNSLMLISHGMNNLHEQIDVDDYMHYINNDKDAESIFKGFFFHFVSIIFLIGLRIPSYCNTWKYLNSDNFKSSNYSLYINMIISSVLHTFFFILMIYSFWIGYKYIKINAKNKRGVIP